MKKALPWMMLLALAGVMVAGCGKKDDAAGGDAAKPDAAKPDAAAPAK